MATRYNYTGKLITDGLVLNLDAAKRDSYPGSGTTWYDLSGNGNNGTLTNGPTYTGVSKDAAFVFDGVDDYVNLGTQTLITDDFTVENWFKVPTTGDAKEHYLMNIGYNSFNSLLFTIDSQINNTFGASAYYRDAVGNVVNYGMGSGVTNTVYHSVLTRNGGTNIAYLNGVVANTFNNSTTLASNLSIQLGWAVPRNKSTAYMNGNIYASKIYNRALSASEITQNFNALRGRYGI